MLYDNGLLLTYEQKNGTSFQLLLLKWMVTRTRKGRINISKSGMKAKVEGKVLKNDTFRGCLVAF